MFYRLVISHPTIAQIEIGGEAAHVRHQLLNRNRVAAFAFHLRDELHDRVAQTNFSLFDEHHDAGGGGHDFGETGQVENRVRRHCFALWFDGARAVRLAPNDTAVAANEHDRTG